MMFLSDIKGKSWAKKNKTTIKRNYKGDIISGPKILADPSFCKKETILNLYGEPEEVPIKFLNFYGELEDAPNWDKIRHTDEEHSGFDIRNVEAPGEYKISISLPIGTKVLRYGDVGGRFTAPVGTPYEKLSLPYIKETVEYHEYEVVADGVVVNCVEVEKGKVAPGFSSTGGAVQYRHKERIGDSLERRALRELDIWGRKAL